MSLPTLVTIALLAGTAACAAGPGASSDSEPSDFDPTDWTSNGKADSAVPSVFDRNNLMSDAMFTATGAVDADAIQALLESSPYGTRSWLADVTVGGQRFSDALVGAATGQGLDPIVLLVRAQVESSLVSATTRPSTTRLNAALGCGCPDNSGCSNADAGVGTQLVCASGVFASKLAESEDGTGQWRRGHARQTSDGAWVTPSTNATAALYAYTPWVLQGSGGNWLAWNVTRKFLKAFDQAGTLSLP